MATGSVMTEQVFGQHPAKQVDDKFGREAAGGEDFGVPHRDGHGSRWRGIKHRHQPLLQLVCVFGQIKGDCRLIHERQHDRTSNVSGALEYACAGTKDAGPGQLTTLTIGNRWNAFLLFFPR